MKTNYHTHSTWCDGKDTPRAMIEAAIQCGFQVLGFSSHLDMVKDVAAYVAEIKELAQEHSDRIKVLCGIEAEFGEVTECRDQFDYIIGSVHWVPSNDGGKVPIDDTPEKLSNGIKQHFAGDAKALIKAYFERERQMLTKGAFQIVGHLDLVRKFNGVMPYFDESAQWYLDEIVKTADAVKASGVIAEVNTGAISRGWIKDAYPSPLFRAELRKRGVKFILSSDAHSVSAIDCAFDQFANAESYVDLV